jgi:hypothetical protein
MMTIRTVTLFSLLMAVAAGPVSAESLAQATATRQPTPTRSTTLTPTPTGLVAGPTMAPTQPAATATPTPGGPSVAAITFTDPIALLDASGVAMDRLASARFGGLMDLQVDAPGMNVAMTLPMVGEYVAPDRIHMLMDASATSSLELISVGGQMWTRTSDHWQQTTPSQLGAPVNPAQISKPNAAEMATYLLSPVLTDTGTSYQIISDMDMVKAMAETSTGPGAFGGDLVDTSYVDLNEASGQMAITVNKASLYVEAMEMRMTFPISDSSGNIAIGIALKFSDFNSPSITVQPPSI